MRISDWRSDVCSSDLGWVAGQGQGRRAKIFGAARHPSDGARNGLAQGRCNPNQPQPLALHPAGEHQHRDDAQPRGEAGPDTDAAPVALECQPRADANADHPVRSAEHTSELQSLMRISYAVFSLKKTKHITNTSINN